MSVSKNNLTVSIPDECTSKSELALLPLPVPQTIHKKTLVFESEEMDNDVSVHKKTNFMAESFNPNQTYQASEFDASPEDDFDQRLHEELPASPPKHNDLHRLLVQRVKVILHSLVYEVFINLVTIYVLVADYFRIMLFRRSSDQIFDVFTFICFFGLLGDFLMMLISQKKYVWSFYFFLDFTMTFMTIFDLTFVKDAIFYNNSDQVALITSSILNIIRIIRLIRIMKFLRTKNSPEVDRSVSKTGKAIARNSETNESAIEKMNLVKKIFLPKESKVTTQLKDRSEERRVGKECCR